METFDAHVTPRRPIPPRSAARCCRASRLLRLLGTAISEAVERALNIPGNRAPLHAGVNQVVPPMVIGLSQVPLEELASANRSSRGRLGGLIAPFMRDKIKGVRPDTRFVAVEPASCPSLTRGRYAYDFADTSRTCPLAKMYTLGNGFLPAPTMLAACATTA